jgi:hypothetical protein
MRNLILVAAAGLALGSVLLPQSLSAQQSAQLQAKPHAGVRVYTPTMKRRLEPPNKAQR